MVNQEIPQRARRAPAGLLAALALVASACLGACASTSDEEEVTGSIASASEVRLPEVRYYVIADT